MTATVWSRDELIAQLRALGVRAGGVLLVHTAFRAVRPVDGGPEGLIAALSAALGPDGTLVMPCWTGDDEAVFDACASEPADDLGVLPRMFRRLPGVVRSPHPFAFAARGPLAAEIVDTGLPLPPHGPDSPVDRVRQADGQVLLLGVGHEADTTLHLAEVLAGVGYRVAHHITVAEDGHAVRIDYGETDHCCQRFALADDWLRGRGLQREGAVGNAMARLVRARDVVAVALERLRAEPDIFLHPPGEGCLECDLARAGGGQDWTPYRTSLGPHPGA
ncbi:MAG: AAC(3) family N-acetyltransferase [Azospirillaceae bacterium]